jgi:hypothetical protein
MKRKLSIVLLSLGALGGFGAGIASLACRHHGGHHSYFERRVRQVVRDEMARQQPRPAAAEEAAGRAAAEEAPP